MAQLFQPVDVPFRGMWHVVRECFVGVAPGSPGMGQKEAANVWIVWLLHQLTGVVHRRVPASLTPHGCTAT